MGTQPTTISGRGAQIPATFPVSPFDRGNSLALRIAETSIEMRAEDGVKLVLSGEVEAFASASDLCDVRINVRRGHEHEMRVPQGRASFESGGLWSVFEENGGRRFVFSSAKLGPVPYKSAWFDGDFRCGEVALYRGCFDAGRPTYPLEYPLDELLMIHRLARGEGVEIHGVGVVDDEGRGHLFVGHSGAGKSTLARLWQKHPTALILSDDRIVLRQRAGRIWMHGTPWHGDAGIASPQAAPLYRTYLLEHGCRTELAGVSKGRAAAEFLARCFVPHYSADAMAFSLEFLERVAQQTPCFAFRFLPDNSAVEVIRRAAE
jgi:hypothetical protein